MSPQDLTNLRALAAKWRTESAGLAKMADILRDAFMFASARPLKERADQFKACADKLTAELDALTPPTAEAPQQAAAGQVASSPAPAAPPAASVESSCAEGSDNAPNSLPQIPPSAPAETTPIGSLEGWDDQVPVPSASLSTDPPLPPVLQSILREMGEPTPHPSGSSSAQAAADTPPPPPMSCSSSPHPDAA